MALSDILLSEGDQYMEFDLPDGSLHSPKDITSDVNGIYELPYISASTGVDVMAEWAMTSEISQDGTQIFIDAEGRVAIRLDKQLIKILD
jgi:hypothetical protein